MRFDLLVYWIVVWSISLSSLPVSSTTLVEATKPVQRNIQTLLPLRKSRYDRFLEKVFEQADTDKDGRLTINDTYEWVLRLYIQINRKAPCNPPTLGQVKRIVHLMDTDRDNSINHDEFRDLADLFFQRAGVRIAANRFIKIVVAPLLAESLLQWIKKQAWLYEKIVVPYMPPSIIPIVTNVQLGRVVCMISLMISLGGFIMEVVDDVLDDQIEDLERRVEKQKQQKARRKKWRNRRKDSDNK